MTAVYVTGGRDTREVARERQADLWRTEVTANQGRLDFAFKETGAFAGGTKVQRCGGLVLVDFWSEPLAYIRHPDAADRDGDDSLRLLLPLSGEFRMSARGADRTVSPGLATAVSMAPGFTIENNAQARALVLTLPSKLWDGMTPTDLPVWELDRGTAAVFNAMVREIAAQREHLDAASFVRACESAAMLLARGDLGSDLLEQARAIVRQYADDIAFDPAALADRLGWSLRSVQLALRRAGTTPAELIRRQRLETALTRLTHPAWQTHPIAHIAHASGFNSLTTFNTTFRTHYGTTPTTLRRTPS